MLEAPSSFLARGEHENLHTYLPASINMDQEDGLELTS